MPRTSSRNLTLAATIPPNMVAGDSALSRRPDLVVILGLLRVVAYLVIVAFVVIVNAIRVVALVVIFFVVLAIVVSGDVDVRGRVRGLTV